MEKRTMPIFRAKRIDNGNWVCGHYFMTPLTDENSGAPSDDGWFFLTGEPRHCIGSNNVAFVIDPKTLGMSTGKTTENTHPMFYDVKELFEGDIFIDQYDTKFTIVFRDFEFIGISNEGDDWGPYTKRISSLGNIKIIGNIHDNPELMKK